LSGLPPTHPVFTIERYEQSVRMSFKSFRNGYTGNELEPWTS